MNLNIYCIKRPRELRFNRLHLEATQVLKNSNSRVVRIIVVILIFGMIAIRFIFPINIETIGQWKTTCSTQLRNTTVRCNNRSCLAWTSIFVTPFRYKLVTIQGGHSACQFIPRTTVLSTPLQYFQVITFGSSSASFFIPLTHIFW